ncbi:MAG TPA: helicase-associated domain-containing protein, partial [Thermomicrobiaceae bacterium]|nr:helicase-associated domain-containing protein [Thermomicrobiaceae bacterium]
ALAMAEAALDGKLRVRPRPATANRAPGYYAPAPTDWQIVAIDKKKAERDRLPYGTYPSLLVPSPPLIDEADLRRLQARTGQPPASIDQSFRLLRSLGVVTVADSRCSIERERLMTLLAIREPERRAILTALWRSQPVSLDVSLLVGEWGELEEIGGPSAALSHIWFGIQQHLTQRRRLLTRLLARMAPDEWHSLGSLITLLERLEHIAGLDPTDVKRGMYLPNQSELWVADRGSRNAAADRLPLGSREGWKLIATKYVAALLKGPLRWLGLVDLTQLATGELAFRPRQEAGTLIGRPYAGVETAGPAGLRFGDDLSVIAPPGQADASIYQRLAAAGELTELAPDGIHFRLTEAGMRSVFESGAGAPEVLAYFEANAAEPLPAVLGETLERWWRDFGRVRLYDEVSLIELADDLLLPELLARTSLGSHLIHQFSPRLVVVETAAVDELRLELTRLGYSPRLIEDEGA